MELLERPEVEPDQNRVDAVTADEMVDWFFANYADPSEGVPYEKTAEGGYVYFLGGPYDAEEVLTDRFPDVPEATLDEAVRQILRRGSEWVKKGQYPSSDRRRLAD